MDYDDIEVVPLPEKCITKIKKLEDIVHKANDCELSLTREMKTFGGLIRKVFDHAVFLQDESLAQLAIKYYQSIGNNYSKALRRLLSREQKLVKNL